MNDYEIGSNTFTITFSATLQLTSNKERWRTPGTMSGLPLHGLPGEALHRSQSLISFLTTTLKVVLADGNSRTIFYFLCINLCELWFANGVSFVVSFKFCYLHIQCYVYRFYFFKRERIVYIFFMFWILLILVIIVYLVSVIVLMMIDDDDNDHGYVNDKYH